MLARGPAAHRRLDHEPVVSVEYPLLARPQQRIAHRLAVDQGALGRAQVPQDDVVAQQVQARVPVGDAGIVDADVRVRSEEHTPELQFLMRVSSAVYCLEKNTISTPITYS